MHEDMFNHIYKKLPEQRKYVDRFVRQSGISCLLPTDSYALAADSAGIKKFLTESRAHDIIPFAG